MLKISKRQLNRLIENFLLLENEVDFNDRKFLLITGDIRSSTLVYDIIINNPEVAKILFKNINTYQKVQDLRSKILEIAYDEYGLRQSIGSKYNSKNLNLFLNALVLEKAVQDASAAQGGNYPTVKSIAAPLIETMKSSSHSDRIKKGMIPKATDEEIKLDNLTRRLMSKHGRKNIPGLNSIIKEKFTEFGNNEEKTAAYITRYVVKYKEVQAFAKKETSGKDPSQIDAIVKEKLENEDKEEAYNKTIETYQYQTSTGETAILTYKPPRDGQQSAGELSMQVGNENIDIDKIRKSYKKELLTQDLPPGMKSFIESIPDAFKYKFDSSTKNKNIERIVENLNVLRITDYKNDNLQLKTKEDGNFMWTTSIRSALCKFLDALLRDDLSKKVLFGFPGNVLPKLDLHNPTTPRGSLSLSNKPAKKIDGKYPWQRIVVEITKKDDYYSAAALLVRGVRDAWEDTGENANLRVYHPGLYSLLEESAY